MDHSYSTIIKLARLLHLIFSGTYMLSKKKNNTELVHGKNKFTWPSHHRPCGQF